MAPTDTRQPYKASSFRKRRRNFSPSITSYSNEGLLALDDPKPKNYSTSRTNGQDNVPDDSKVVNNLKRMGVKVTVSEKQKQLNIKFLLCTSEAEYFEFREDEISQYLKENFGISGIALSKLVEGVIDRILFVYGDIISISRAAVYVAFVLNARLNNLIPSESYTLKSPNYKINVLLQGSYNDEKLYLEINKVADNCGLREFDISSLFNYNNNPRLISVRLKGDFNSLFNFLMLTIDASFSSAQTRFDYNDDSKINQLRAVSVFDNAGLFQVQDINRGVLDEHVNKALEYIYSKSFLKPTSEVEKE
ncbi:uncharacterized protein AC631_00227 [Debaryomyces fabryi]|uniref:Uncharacterized protein n=1 Tax=Debaryomyces fabryi TaxID=58627 RepID=A0A0V1Q6N8_9ASCO|nr:uncharacterized protein AC631_00227 [Debaryomyces fabryi]KSA03957.1 hypothetical protein AC631_00227 [Debaryomyces fabryi]CUM57623.1 unnamed protein product [Debaryomyces fabryi]